MLVLKEEINSLYNVNVQPYDTLSGNRAGW
jgi:hypothetical protein